MKSVAEIFAYLNSEHDLRIIRNDIADLLEYHLDRSDKEKKDNAIPYFANAVATLALNVHSENSMSPVGLHACLTYLDMAIAKSNGYPLPGKNPELLHFSTNRSEYITYGLLIDVLISLRAAPSFHTIKH